MTGVDHVIRGDVGRIHVVFGILVVGLLQYEGDVPLGLRAHHLIEVHDDADASQILGFGIGQYIVLADGVAHFEVEVISRIVVVVDVGVLHILDQIRAILGIGAPGTRHGLAILIDEASGLGRLPLFHRHAIAAGGADIKILIRLLDVGRNLNDLFGLPFGYISYDGGIVRIDDGSIDCSAVVLNGLDIAIVLGYHSPISCLKNGGGVDLHRGRDSDAEAIVILAGYGVALQHEVTGNKLHNGLIIDRRIAQAVMSRSGVHEVASYEGIR